MTFDPNHRLTKFVAPTSAAPSRSVIPHFKPRGLPAAPASTRSPIGREPAAMAPTEFAAAVIRAGKVRRNEIDDPDRDLPPRDSLAWRIVMAGRAARKGRGEK